MPYLAQENTGCIHCKRSITVYNSTTNDKRTEVTRGYKTTRTTTNSALTKQTGIAHLTVLTTKWHPTVTCPTWNNSPESPISL